MRHRRGYPALTSSWKETFAHLFPTLRGLERPVRPALRLHEHKPDLPAEPCDTDLAADISEFNASPIARRDAALLSLPGGTGQ